MRIREQASALAIGLFLILTGCSSGSSTTTGFHDDFAWMGPSYPNRELPGLTKVNGLPPVVLEARGRASAAQAVGPSNPHIEWGLALPFSESNIISSVGGDGTAYVAGADGVGAVQEGKLKWAFRARRPRVTMDDEGRIWFQDSEAGGVFCLNRNGQGGLLQASIAPPAAAAEPPLVGCSEGGRSLSVQGRRDVPLDYACTRPQAKLGPDGMAYVATDAPDVRAYTPDGELAWKISVPCAAQQLIAGPGHRVLFACRDRSLHFIENGKLRWSTFGDGDLEEGSVRTPFSSFVGLMDRNGTTYFVDHPTGRLSTHIHAVSAKSDNLWTLRTWRFYSSSIAFDGHGRIYLSGLRGMQNWLVCISD